jgi:hypothetical protein
MILEIQPNIHCENCSKCGSRPHIEQQKKFWIVTCPNKNCKNFVKGELVNIEGWNKINKPNASLNQKQDFKKTA